MNLKTVCNKTWLSRKAVRYYIDEELISPACTENYYGRKIYKFTDEDVEALIKFSKEIPYSEDLEEPEVWGKIYSTLKAIIGIAIVWFPILISLYFFINNLAMFRYPVVEWWLVLIGLVFLLPSIVAIAISKLRFRFKKAVFVILFILCILSNAYCILPFGFCITESYTENPKNYRKIDYKFPIDGNLVYEELFPADIPDTAEDEVYRYQYRHVFSPIYDVYARWSLPEEEYLKEVDRVTALLEAALENNGDSYKLESIDKGDYTCIVFYWGERPFTQTDSIYTYLVFAYNDKTNTVRYLYCSSHDSGVDQPYYLKLDW